MDTFQQLWLGFQVALTPTNLMFAFIGVLAGQLIGVLPGIGPSAGVAILLPVTFGVNPVSAMIMFAGIYYGAMYGGTITSILVNIPGESSSVMTCLDGYQMGKKGQAGKALGIAAFGSFFAGTIGVIGLMFFAPWLAGVALSFGPPEYAALMVMSLILIIGLTSQSMAKGIACFALGLFMSVIGVDVVTGQPRFTFGQVEFLDGIDFVPVAMGVFGIAEVLDSLAEGKVDMKNVKLRFKDLLPNLRDWAMSIGPIIRGSFIGFFVGMMPGSGATACSMVSYATERKLSKTPGRFGTGAIEGVAGPEAANNAASVGGLVPLLTLGIPSSATTAVMLGGLLMFGLRPGPLLFEQNPEFIWGLIASMYIGNLMLVILNTVFIPVFVAAVRIQAAFLLPMIVTFTIIGAYSMQNSMFLVWLMLGMGVVGFFMKKLGYPPAPMVLALVLGNTLESAFRQSLQMSQGNLGIFFERPLSAFLMVAAFIMALFPLFMMGYRALKKRLAAG
ncbi:MAG: tripartite tricarboxylate transporter permease [Deltaproteobacteria bacterium]|nr:tripartite tricarboxylate transporter permease [Deltaproteobacteria bacterium]